MWGVFDFAVSIPYDDDDHQSPPTVGLRDVQWYGSIKPCQFRCGAVMASSSLVGVCAAAAFTDIRICSPMACDDSLSNVGWIDGALWHVFN